MPRLPIPTGVVPKRRLWKTQREVLENNFNMTIPTAVEAAPTRDDPEGWYVDPAGDVYLRHGTAMYALTAVVTDPAAPTLTSATVAANGTTVTLVFSAALTGDPGGWSMLEDGENPVGLTYASGGGTATHVYTADPTVLLDQTLTISYTAPAGGLTAGTYKVPLAAISAAAVTNNSTQTE